jgi:hypothetical protein
MTSPAPATTTPPAEAPTTPAPARAHVLRQWAADAPSPLATALRRRAAELELLAAASGARALAA